MHSLTMETYVPEFFEAHQIVLIIDQTNKQKQQLLTIETRVNN